MDRLHGGLTLILIGISKVQSREGGDLETQEGKLKDVSLKSE